MNETNHLIALFGDLYNRQPWLDVTILDTLKRITVSKAQFRISPGGNSIWEIVNHMICWRENVLQRIQGKMPVTPDHNYFETVKDQSDKAWEQTLLKFKNSQEEWIKFLENFNVDELDKVSLVNNTSHYKHIHGVMQHDAYHLGQLVLLIKLAEEKNK